MNKGIAGNFGCSKMTQTWRSNLIFAHSSCIIVIKS